MTVTWIAGLMTLPAIVYLSANLIEWASGSEGTSGVFGTSFDNWSTLGLTLLVVGGPLLGFAISTLGSIRIRGARRDEGGVSATFEMQMPRRRLAVAVTNALLVGGTVAYWLAENWPCLYGRYLTC